MEKTGKTEHAPRRPAMRTDDALARARRELEWTDRMEGPDPDSAPEPTYPDGSVQHECWYETGYTRKE